MFAFSVTSYSSDPVAKEPPPPSPKLQHKSEYQVSTIDDDRTPTPATKFHHSSTSKEPVIIEGETHLHKTPQKKSAIIINGETWDTHKVEQLLKQKQSDPSTKLKLQPYQLPGFDVWLNNLESDLAGATPLYAACAYAELDLLKALLTLQLKHPDEDIGLAAVNKHSKHTPFSIACKYEHKDIISVLLDFHAQDPKISIGLEHLTLVGNSILRQAVIENKKVTVKLLLNFITQHPELTNFQNTRCKNESEKYLWNLGVYYQYSASNFPLYIATQKRYSDIVRLLLEFKRTNPHIQIGTSQPHKTQRNTAFQLACKQGDLTTAALFLHFKLQAPNSLFQIYKPHLDTHNSPLFEAVIQQKVEVVALLINFKIKYPEIDIGADDLHKQKGTTPLFEACKIGNPQIVRLFLTLKAAVPNADIGLADVHPSTGNTPFFEVCERGHVEVLNEFLEFIPQHEDIDTGIGWLHPHSKNPPFFHVIINNQTPMVDRFLKFKALHPHIVIGLHYQLDDSGDSVFHIATRQGNLAQVKQLLAAKKSNPRLLIGENYLNHKEFTPVHEASILGQTEVIEHLVNLQSQEPDLQLSFAYQHPTTGETPLIAAIKAEQPETVKAMLSNRYVEIGIDIPDPETKLRPAQLANRKKQVEIDKLLQELDEQFEKDSETIEAFINSLHTKAVSTDV
ncbi:ankyrin repeat domain-containing protein [Parashewanella curva]|uniref:Ankyrin repeat domain-containing protein n=1 Tax=Parashewanella curva TaxID=2338552 RepID=A0A3L8PWZ2_9GAMM|nr:ankyrin repeat domain-containing protein [Parashewanella curva]RLV59309.1 ankyrin repeat domain-containing protein [Parashewanella curva]